MVVRLFCDEEVDLRLTGAEDFFRRLLGTEHLDHAADLVEATELLVDELHHHVAEIVGEQDLASVMEPLVELLHGRDVILVVMHEQLVFHVALPLGAGALFFVDAAAFRQPARNLAIADLQLPDVVHLVAQRAGPVVAAGRAGTG